jgi:hypothetical protein
MSWAEDMGYDSYDPPEGMEEVKRLFVTKNGTKICNNCGSKNIKVSKAGNEYCADLCWVEIEAPNQSGEGEGR